MKFNLPKITSFNLLLKNLENGLRKLTFQDNFQADVKQVSFAAQEEKEVVHNLQQIPNYYILGRQSGEGQIIDGDTPFSESAIYLKNTSNNPITATVIIMR